MLETSHFTRELSEYQKDIIMKKHFTLNISSLFWYKIFDMSLESINQVSIPGPIYQLIKRLTGAQQETITPWYIETRAQSNVRPLPIRPPLLCRPCWHYTTLTGNKWNNPSQCSVSTSRLTMYFCLPHLFLNIHYYASQSMDNLMSFCCGWCWHRSSQSSRGGVWGGCL